MLRLAKYYDDLPWLSEAREQLKALVENDNCPHALLLHGSAGMGRRQLALWLTRDVLGFEAARFVPEDAGDAAARNYHPDLYVIEPEEKKASIGVNQVRALIDFLALTSHGQQGRIALIWPAEQMTVNAANSLLKTLEEPPRGTILVLISDSLTKLPATVVSRCQHMRIPTAPREIALNWLSEQGAAEQGGLLDFAGGAPLAALELYNDKFVDTAREYAADLRKLQQRNTSPVDVATRWKNDPDMALRWLDWRLTRNVREALVGPETEAAKPDFSPNQHNIRLCYQQMSQIRELRRLLKGGINAELGIAGLLMDWYGGFGSH